MSKEVWKKEKQARFMIRKCCKVGEEKVYYVQKVAIKGASSFLKWAVQGSAEPNLWPRFELNPSLISNT